jgi:hypothetical protein
VDREFFERGETVEAFLADLGDNRPRFEQLLAESELSGEALRQIRRMPNDLYVLVIAEPWSGDVIYFLPPLVRMAEEAQWEVRIFRRDLYPDLITPYLKENLYRSIPVFVFYDRDFRKLGHWIERPAEATRLIDEESLKLRRRLREEHKEAWRQEAVQEIVHLLKPRE